MNAFYLCLLTIAAGTTMSVQAGINAQLQRHWAQSPLLASCVSFIVGALGLIAYVIIMRVPIPAFPEKIVPWHWAGGFLGAFLVSVTVYTAPRLGAVTMVALILAGQMGMAVMLDHFGLLGYAQRSITWQRLLGVALLGAGVFLIRKF